MRILFQESEDERNVSARITVFFILLIIFFNSLGISLPCFFTCSIFFKKNFYFQKIRHFVMKYISHFKLSITFFDSIFPVSFFALYAWLIKYKSNACCGRSFCIHKLAMPASWFRTEMQA